MTYDPLTALKSLIPFSVRLMVELTLDPFKIGAGEVPRLPPFSFYKNESFRKSIKINFYFKGVFTTHLLRVVEQYVM
jgi:hypothetical protein